MHALILKICLVFTTRVPPSIWGTGIDWGPRGWVDNWRSGSWRRGRSRGCGGGGGSGCDNHRLAPIQKSSNQTQEWVIVVVGLILSCLIG